MKKLYRQTYTKQKPYNDKKQEILMFGKEKNNINFCFYKISYIFALNRELIVEL